MLPALLTTFFFAISSFCAARSTRLVGATSANFLRLLVAIACLSAFAFTFGTGLKGVGLFFLMASGAIGIGFGDFFGFQAIKRIGPQLTALLVQCFCAPVAAILEFSWLGTRLAPLQIAGGAIALGGATLSLLPGVLSKETKRVFSIGALLALGGAVAQAGGAVLTRKANESNLAAGFIPDNLTAAFQRLCGALFVMTIIFILVQRYTAQSRPTATIDLSANRRKAAPWIIANGLAGLVLGVACFQWALRETPASIVLSIIALTPLIIMLLTWLFEKNLPTRHAIIGGAIAIAGIIILQWK